jgi:HSP20 family protein
MEMEEKAMRCVPSIRRITQPSGYWPEASLFSSFFEEFPFGGPVERRMAPAVDILEKDGNLLIEAELPGINEKEIALKIEGNILTLSGERKLENEEKRESYRRIERSYGSFSRAFTLPETADRDKIKAEYKNGILTITVPLKPEARPREVPIAIQ